MTRRRILLFAGTLVCLVSGVLHQPLGAQDARFRLRGPSFLSGRLGQTVTTTVACVVSSDVEMKVCGYEIGVRVQGANILDMSVDNTAGQVHGGDGFVQLTETVSDDSAVARVVLPGDECLELFSGHEAPLAELRLEVELGGALGAVAVGFVDGLSASGSVGAFTGPVFNTILVEDGQITPQLQELVVPLYEGEMFFRGDFNSDGKLDVSDAVSGLGHMFRGSAGPPCMDSADTNDDGRLDIADAVFVLEYQFGGGRAPPAPRFQCGPDPTADNPLCEKSAPCGTATVSWTPPSLNSDGTENRSLVGYRVYYDRRSRQSHGGDYLGVVDVGPVTTHTIHGLPLGRHYFTVTTYDHFGRESDFSVEKSKIIVAE